MDYKDVEPTITHNRSRHKIVYISLFFIIFLLLCYYAFSAPSDNKSFLNNQSVIIHVSKGDTLTKVSHYLETKRIVKESFYLKAFFVMFKLNTKLKTGDYKFDEPLPVWMVAWQLSKGNHMVDPVKITLKEGVTNHQIIDILSDKFVNFRKDLFISDYRFRQGYLFPDTYFFFPLSTSDEIIDEISTNFKIKTNQLKNNLNNSNRKFDDIIIMASIIEKEANGDGDRELISGILWKRLDLGMPLQVDVAPETYKKAGLPDEPISNPGLESIKASINPKQSDYLFYLHDKYGNVHFAETFNKHKLNIKKYLKQI